jgi:hypothetical protein
MAGSLEAPNPMSDAEQRHDAYSAQFDDYERLKSFHANPTAKSHCENTREEGIVPDSKVVSSEIMISCGNYDFGKQSDASTCAN